MSTAHQSGYLQGHQPNCMGCGPENPAGIGLRLRADDERVVGTVSFDNRHEGAPGFVHGGAVATVMDDAFGMVLLVIERPAVTASLNIDFRAPALLERELRVEVWCERIEGRKLHLAGTLQERGETLAEASGLFIVVPVEHFLKGGKTLPDDWKPR